MKNMTIATAQSKSLIANTKTLAGYTVYDVAQGHIVWLRDVRKNKIVTASGNDDFSAAEICYAFTQDPKSIQKTVGSKATKIVNDFLLGTPTKVFELLVKHAAEQMQIYLKTLTSPKKAPAAVSRKPAARRRKR